MTNFVTSATYQCPTCSTPAQEQRISESCRLLPSGMTPSPESILAVCIRTNALKNSLENDSAAPCQQCRHNEIFEDTGTFIAMKQLGEREWGEMHQCPNCNTPYIVSSAIAK